MFTQDSSQVLESQWGLPGPYFQWKEVPRDSSLLAPETETETGYTNKIEWMEHGIIMVF